MKYHQLFFIQETGKVQAIFKVEFSKTEKRLSFQGQTWQISRKRSCKQHKYIQQICIRKTSDFNRFFISQNAPIFHKNTNFGFSTSQLLLNFQHINNYLTYCFRMQTKGKYTPTRKNLSKSGKSPFGEKSKENNDTIFIIENQNEILKLKNIQMEEKIATMKLELARLGNSLAQDQQECQDIRKAIKNTHLTEDIQLQSQKKNIEDKIALTRGNFDIMVRKIKDARQAALLEQDKIPNMRSDKISFEKQLWDIRAQNEGTKIVLEDLEKQLEKLRGNNESLAAMRKDYGPAERQISVDIERRIQTVKNKKNVCDEIRKKETSKIMFSLFRQLQMNKNKEAFTLLQRYSLVRKNMKKRVYLLSLIRKKYLLSKKSDAFQAFRISFRPLEEQNKFTRIIQNTRFRRIKNRMFRIWRNQAIKMQYTLIRRFEVQNQLEKLSQSIEKSNLYSSFNLIKNWQRNPLHQRGIQIIDGVHRNLTSRVMNWFVSSLIKAQNQYLNSQELEESANQHSKYMVLSACFSNWAKITKSNKVSNRIIKFKYFRELKKLIKIKNQRALSDMLVAANEKMSEIDKVSSNFCQIKKQTVRGLLDELNEDLQEVGNKNSNLSNNIKKTLKEKTNQYHALGLLKISKHLKGRTQKAFDVWRNLNRKVSKFKLIYNMLHNKVIADVNFAFACIQRRKFQKLKLSIADKIQSCEFSYNYLVDQNKHIKEVLDTKTLDLQKNKFVTIIRRLARQQKQLKHKYFHKFMKNGLNYWKFRKVYQKMDRFLEKKIKISFMFMLKFINQEKNHEQLIERVTQRNKLKLEKQVLERSFIGFKFVTFRNKKIRKILQNVTNRNMELNVYIGYNLIKRRIQEFNEQQLESQKEKIIQIIRERDIKTDQTENWIQILRERLRGKQSSIANRKILACRKFFIKNSTNKVLHYLNRWRNRVDRERRIIQFAQILERKTRIILKNRFIINLFKKQSETQINQLRTKLKNYHEQLQNSTREYEDFLFKSEESSRKMKEQNDFHTEEGQILEKKTQKMDDVRVKTFQRYWNKQVCSFVFRQLKNRRQLLIQKFTRMFELISSCSVINTYEHLTGIIRQQMFHEKIRNNLSTIYTKKFRNNAGLAFKIWRMTNLNKKVAQYKQSLNEELDTYHLVEDRLDSMTKRHLDYVDFRANNRKLRKIFDWMKKHTQWKLQNNKNKRTLETWLQKGYQAEFFTLFKRQIGQNVQKNKKADSFIMKKIQQRGVKFFYDLKTIVKRKSLVKKLFFNKFCFYQMQHLYQEFFTKAKNYFRYTEVKKKNYQTFCIQKCIQTFERKRKNILCDNFRKWRKNQFQIHMGKKLLKRLTRKAIINRYKDMFYTWKVETEAKKVLNYHHEQGEVKKRKAQILRIQKFIDDFKKQKGLLLENQEGNFVMSPRFQKKKEEAERKENNFRYKFISRLIMSMNGYSTPIKAYGNMQMYMKLREKYKKGATFVLNHLRKPDLLLSFNTWKKAAADFRDNFESMQRKELIKILNRQKDKLEMEYSKKLGMDEKIQSQLKRYKALSHQRERREKLCVHIFIKNAKKVKQHAFRSWRNNVDDLKDMEAEYLAERGYSKIHELEEDIRDLQDAEAQLQRNNEKLREAVNDALQIAEMVRRISEQRDKLSNLILEKNISCQSLVEQNEVLNSKLYLAQKQAMNLLIISNQQP